MQIALSVERSLYDIQNVLVEIVVLINNLQFFSQLSMLSSLPISWRKLQAINR